MDPPGAPEGHPLRDTEATPSTGPGYPLPPTVGSSGSRVSRFLWEARGSIVITAAAVAGAIAVFFLLGLAGAYDVGFILRNLPAGVGPVEISLEFTTFSFVLGLAGALGLGLIRAYPPKGIPGRLRKLWRWPLYAFASGYVAAVRGTPFLVQLFIVYYVIIFTAPRFTILGWDQGYWAGFLALLINTTGYQAEAFRGGFQSVDAGQIEAARAMGLGRLRIFVLITLPQSLRLVTLPLANEWISNFKTATILSYIGIFEVFNWARTDIALLDDKVVEAFVLLAIFYLFINVTLSRVVTYIEKVRRIPGLGSQAPETGTLFRLAGVER